QGKGGADLGGTLHRVKGVVAIEEVGDGLLQGSACGALILQSQFAAGAGGVQIPDPVRDKGLKSAGLDGGIGVAGALLMEQDAARPVQQGLSRGIAPGGLLLRGHTRLRSRDMQADMTPRSAPSR